MNKQTVIRPTTCRTCFGPIEPKATGRPRWTCSDRCRKAHSRLHRRISHRDGFYHKRKMDGAERQVRRWERRFGPIDDTIPVNGRLTRRRTFLVRLGMGQEIPWCRVCNRPFLEEEGVYPYYCSVEHKHEAKRKAEILLRAINQWDGDYDPRVDVRLRLDLPIKTCKRCIKPFPAYQPKQIFCTPNCRKAHWRETHPICPGCGDRFPKNPDKPNHTFCGSRCLKRVGARRRRAQARDAQQFRAAA